MKNILDSLFNTPEAHAALGSIVTFLFAWVKRKLDLGNMAKKHAIDLQELRDSYEARLVAESPDYKNGAENCPPGTFFKP